MRYCTDENETDVRSQRSLTIGLESVNPPLDVCGKCEETPSSINYLKYIKGLKDLWGGWRKFLSTSTLTGPALRSLLPVFERSDDLVSTTEQQLLKPLGFVELRPTTLFFLLFLTNDV